MSLLPHVYSITRRGPPPHDVGTDESMTGDPSEDPSEIEPNPLFKNDA